MEIPMPQRAPGTPRGHRFALTMLAASLLLANPAARAADAAVLEELRALKERIRQLEERLGADTPSPAPTAQAATPPATSAPAPAAAPDERIGTLERKVDDLLAASARPQGDTGLPIHGFADVLAGNSGINAGTDRPHGFSFGTLSFYMTPQFTANVKALLELAFETSDGALATDLERAQIGYVVSDAATVWAGRFHTPYGYYNTAFHHGAHVMTAVTRPKFLDFEDKGGILQAHSVGLWVNGRTNLGPGKLQYDAYVTNGDKISNNTLDFNFGADDNGKRAVGATVGYRYEGLLAGVHMLQDHVDTYAAPGVVTARTKVQMTGGYALYDDHDFEIIGEYYRFRNQDLVNGGDNKASSAWFIQVGHNFGLWTPYARAERTRLDQTDHFFLDQTNGRSYRRAVVGLRYEIDPKAALKFEAGKVRQTDVSDADYGELRVQLAIRF